MARRPRRNHGAELKAWAEMALAINPDQVDALAAAGSIAIA
jgi:hypothetical protein